MDDPKTGDKATCSMCSAEIEYVGPYWRHVGENQPRHPATPKEPGAEPLQPLWFTQLDSREQAQVQHALTYSTQHASAGIPGHNHIMLIAKLARILGEQPVKVQKVAWDGPRDGIPVGCWRDLVTGVRVDIP